MKGNATGNLHPLVVVLLAIAAMGWAWSQVDSVETRSAPADVLSPPAPAEADGHGNYCLVPGIGAYFYGGSFAERFGTYGGFAAWCDKYNGSIGWIE